MEEQTKLEQLEIRLQNLNTVLTVIKFEIQEILEEIEKLESYTPVGFRYNQHNNENNA